MRAQIHGMKVREEDSFALDGIKIAVYLHKYASIPPPGMPTYRKIKASVVGADALKGTGLDICPAQPACSGCPCSCAASIALLSSQSCISWVGEVLPCE